MTDEQYWGLLDKAALRSKTNERIIEFAKLLMEGYEKGYTILEIAKNESTDSEYSSQLYAGDKENKALFCCTNLARAKKF